MNRAERLAALEALLARVQANVAGRAPPGDGRRDDVQVGAADVAPIDPVPEVRAAARWPRHVDAPRVLAPEELGEWSSLLERELRDPSPIAEAEAQLAAIEEPAPASRPDPGPSSVPVPRPDPVPVPVPGPVPGPGPGPVPGPASNGDEAGPSSELARAIREAAAGPPAVEPAALWSEAAADLKGRRGGVPAGARSPRTPSEVAPIVASARAPRAPRRAPRPRSRPRGATAPRLALAVLGLSAIAVTLALTWRLVGRASTATTTPSAGLADERRPDVAAPASPSALVPASQRVATHGPAAPSPAIDPVRPSSSSTIASPAAGDPPPTVRRPIDHGLLRVDSADPVDVYLQGVRVGESGRWLEVPCGVRNARLAGRGSPPPGHSFPMWLGGGRTVHVPCGAAHVVQWTWE